MRRNKPALPPADPTVVIKKYGNRRLYDTSASRYVNLDDIAAQVRNGKEIKIVDAKTGEDLTRVTLTQIIVEDARGAPTGLPLEMLRQLIVASDQVGREFIMWYLKSAFDAYRKVQDTLHTGLNTMQRATLSPLETMRSFIRGGPPSDSTPAASAELEELRRRVAELEGTQRRPKRKPARGARGQKRR